MATVNEKMTAIADAIREKTGTTEPLSLDQMAIEIATIENNGEATEEFACLDKVGLQRFWYNTVNKINQIAKSYTDSIISAIKPITDEEVDEIFSAAGLILPAAEEVAF